LDGRDTMNPVLLTNGFCFGEGPRWFEGLLWFSDMLGEAVHTVTLDGATTTLPLAGHAPSGLGFRPDGSLLIASTESRQVLRYDGECVTTIADLSDMVSANLGDMVIDDLGRAYVGSQARDGGVIVRIGNDDTASVVADHLEFPNGMVITPDRTTLIVAESTARRLTAFTIDSSGGLGDRRLFADDLDGPPDGITLDAGGGIWASMTLCRQFQRIIKGGNVTDRIDIADRMAIACTLGGPDRRTLFLLSSTDAYPERLVGTKLSRVDTVRVDVAGAGLP
jgi:sugar lactone lactonase YvrE